MESVMFSRCIIITFMPQSIHYETETGAAPLAEIGWGEHQTSLLAQIGVPALVFVSLWLEWPTVSCTGVDMLVHVICDCDRNHSMLSCVLHSRFDMHT
jgi:hypothetical protein